MRYITGSIRLVLLGLLILFILCAALFVFPLLGWRRRGPLARRMASWIPVVLGLRVAIRGALPDPAARRGYRDGAPGFMVCANHISFVDIFIIESFLPAHFVAKKEIAAWPIFGAITTAAGTIYIDRSRKRAVLEVGEVMKSAMEAGENVLFFPEGTTGPGDALLPFHANLFAAAVEAKTDVLPVTIRYTLKGETTTLASYAERPLWEVLKAILYTPGLAAEVTILPPIDASTNDRRAISSAASRDMARALGFADATALQEAALAKLRAERLAALKAKEANAQTPQA